jgi:hypothetical protein
LLYVVTILAVMAFGVGAALKEGNCPEGGLRLDSGVRCDYTVLEAAVIVITLLTLASSIVVISIRLALRMGEIACARRNRDA